MNYRKNYETVARRLALEVRPTTDQRNSPMQYEGGRADESVRAQKWVPSLKDRMRGLQNPMPNGSPFELVGGSDEA